MGMNVGIVTVYNSENCGSFLQAYAMNQYLISEGHNVFFYKRNPLSTSHDPLRLLFDCVQLAARGKIVFAKSRMSSYLAFNRAQNVLTVVPQRKFIRQSDVIIIGSDTLWNFCDPYFNRHKKLFVGSAFGNLRVITYSISVANTPLEQIVCDSDICKGIRSLSAISVRDEITADVVKAITGCSPIHTVDPTLLIDSEAYRRIEEDIPKGRYLLLYCFGKLCNETKKAIRGFADANACTIVSIGQDCGVQDIYEPLDPFRFLGYYRRASFVVTDTFHGCVFSIIYKKNFVALGNEKAKVVSLLNSLKLECQICDTWRGISEILNNVPDYSTAYDVLEGMRCVSKDYVNCSLQNTCGGINEDQA